MIKWNVGSMPPEHDSIFKKFFGTEKWMNVMFCTTSNEVLVTINANGQKFVRTAHTIDGKWRSTYLDNHPERKVIAWADFPEPYSE